MSELERGFSSSAVEQTNHEESVWTKLARCTSVVAQGCWEGVGESVSDELKSPQAVENSLWGVAIGAGLCIASSRAGAIGTIGRFVGNAIGFAFLTDAPRKIHDIAEPVVRSFQSGSNLEGDREEIARRLGPLLVDAGVYSIGALIGGTAARYRMAALEGKTAAGPRFYFEGYGKGANRNDWMNLYEQAFPRESWPTVDYIENKLSRGEYHPVQETRDGNKLVTFSTFSTRSISVDDRIRTFHVLEWLVTDASARSSGIGSAHLEALISSIRRRYPDSLGIVGEIPSPEKPGLKTSEIESRSQLLNFAASHGFEKIAPKYYFPNTENLELGKPMPAELLMFKFQPGSLSATTTARMVRSIYEDGYNVDITHPRLQSVLLALGDYPRTFRSLGTESTQRVRPTLAEISKRASGGFRAVPRDMASLYEMRESKGRESR